jgi:hypothetical protein
MTTEPRDTPKWTHNEPDDIFLGSTGPDWEGDNDFDLYIRLKDFPDSVLGIARYREHEEGSAPGAVIIPLELDPPSRHGSCGGLERLILCRYIQHLEGLLDDFRQHAMEMDTLT